MSLYPVVILAGGLATRLRPITERIPKALVEVGGQPFIAHQLRLLKSHGVQHVIISAWYKGEMIREYVGNGNQFGMDVEYVFDGDYPLGTGGAIRQALTLFTDPFPRYWYPTAPDCGRLSSGQAEYDGRNVPEYRHNRRANRNRRITQKMDL